MGGFEYNTARKGRLYQLFKELGPRASLDVSRKRKATVLTPERSEAALNALREMKKSKQAATVAKSKAGKSMSARSVRRLAQQNKAKFVKGGPKMMVRTPWHARWRLQFAEWVLEEIQQDRIRVKDILFTDEKKFCLSADEGGHYIIRNKDGSFPETNTAREQNMTDAEYTAWLKSRPRKLPKSKSHGKYPCFVWGGVGVGMKTSLIFLKPKKGKKKKETLTTEIYVERMLPEVLKIKKLRTRPGLLGLGTKMLPLWVVQDNDSKHYTELVKDYFKTNKLKVLATSRLSADGEPDTARGAFGRMVTYPLDDLRFPAYSPDINGPIEKSWRELDLRVLERGDEIHCWKDMKRVIEEEWAKLEFEPVTRPCGRHWIGINAWCRQFQDVCEEVVAENGWDTRYMK